MDRIHQPNHRWIIGCLITFLLLLVPASFAQEGSPQAKNPDDELLQEPVKKKAPPATSEKPAKQAAPTDDAESPPATKSNQSQPATGVMGLIEASGSIGVVIILLSILGMALIIELFMTIRKGKLAPKALVEDLHASVAAADFSGAEEICKSRPCYLSAVIQSGLVEARSGYTAIEKAMEQTSQEQANRLFRRVEYLAVLGNIAPMLGLLGTVYGILLAFKKVAESRGTAVAADLADGIYLALVTTVEGLVVAIPALCMFAFFRNRIESLSEEIGRSAEYIFANMKRRR